MEPGAVTRDRCVVVGRPLTVAGCHRLADPGAAGTFVLAGRVSSALPPPVPAA